MSEQWQVYQMGNGDLVAAKGNPALRVPMRSLAGMCELANELEEMLEEREQALSQLGAERDAADAQAEAVRELVEALEAAVGDFDAPCPHCQGKGLIPGSKNWVTQGSVEASCWHCGATGKAVNLPWYGPAEAAIAKHRQPSPPPTSEPVEGTR